MACRAVTVWSGDYLAYDFGEHPMSPVRLDLTMRLAGAAGVLDHLQVVAPQAPTTAELEAVHDPGYLAALRTASTDAAYRGYGIGSEDNPRFDGMYDAAVLIGGGSQVAARAVLSGAADHAVNLAGGLHHAMRDTASGFCLVNDVVLAIRALLSGGVTRVAYVDVDVHHGDGVQDAFYDDPRVLTVSLHQDPRTLFPGTGLPTETGTGAGDGYAVNVALPPGTRDAGWLRAFRSVVPGALRAFAPEVLVTQGGCDTHHDDPLANLGLTVDGQATVVQELHVLAHEHAGGRWVALGGGGYNVVRCVPLTWTQLMAAACDRPIDLDVEIPASWRDDLRRRGLHQRLPERFGELPPERRVHVVEPWLPGGETWLDRSIGATRNASFPLLGLDPDDPRD